jgi:hypothetical protein
VSRFFHDLQERDTGLARHLLRRPGRLLRAAADLARLPRLTVSVGPTTDGRTIVRAVVDKHPLRRAFPHAAVLVLPEEEGRYALGHSKQTLRRKVRKAEQRGITWRRVDDRAEREELVKLADEWERLNPTAQYRNPNPDNSVLLAHPLWLAAHAADGRPLLLSVTPVDGEWALLRFFKTIGSGDDQSLARYYLTQVLVEHLVRAGVRYLFDVTSPLMLPNGLRHYQRMIGFRVFRLRVDRRARAAGRA